MKLIFVIANPISGRLPMGQAACKVLFSNSASQTHSQESVVSFFANEEKSPI